MQTNENLIVPFFKTVAVLDERASREQGRPIYKDEDHVEVRIAGDRYFQPTFPAHSMWRKVKGAPVTYAERWQDEYAKFKAGQEQVAAGTPLSELPFLTEGKRQTLRAAKVYTAEALASLEGKNLTSLGPNGREMKNQATAYLENARGSASFVNLAAEVEELKRQLAEARAEPDDEKEGLKAQIAELAGSRPRGNPSVETLRETLAELKV